MNDNRRLPSEEYFRRLNRTHQFRDLVREHPDHAAGIVASGIAAVLIVSLFALIILYFVLELWAHTGGLP